MARHSTLTGADAIHQASYYQSSDPGAVGAGKDWWDTTADPPTLYRRNEDNDDWITVVDPDVIGAPSGSVGGDLSGTLPNPTIASDVSLPGNPTTTTQTAGNNTTRIATTAFVKTALDNLVAAAPGALDTLDELAAALGDDANFAATVVAALATKAPLSSPALTDTPTAPTAAPGTNTTQVATTAFVEAAVAAGGGGGGAARTVETVTTGSLADLAVATGTVPLGKTGVLLKVETSHACWVRLYATAAFRTADASRLISVDPNPGFGVMFELLSTADVLDRTLAPPIWYSNDDGTPVGDLYYSIQNRSGGTTAVTVDFTHIPLET